LETAVKEQGNPFAHVDHSAGAAGVGLVLRPTEVLIFGNPRAGILLIRMICRFALSSGRTTMTAHGCRTSPAEIARQYGITNREDLLSKMGESVKLAVESATKCS
jgi:hypothetical protein